MDFYGDLAKLLAILLPILGAFAWLNSRMAGLSRLVFSQSEKILNKLEYHERHDDERFEAVRKDLWQLRVSNAARTGKTNGDH